jgi:hypothetical protein
MFLIVVSLLSIFTVSPANGGTTAVSNSSCNFKFVDPPSFCALGAQYGFHPGLVHTLKGKFEQVMADEFTDGRFGNSLLVQIHMERPSGQPHLDAPVWDSKQKLKLPDCVPVRELGCEIHLGKLVLDGLWTATQSFGYCVDAQQSSQFAKPFFLFVSPRLEWANDVQTEPPCTVHNGRARKSKR